MRVTRTVTALLASGVVVSAVSTIGLSGTAQAAAAVDTTSARERARVDSVKAVPRWFDCSSVLQSGVATDRADCGEIRLPLDYDKPSGATTTIAVVRVKARKPAQRIGSLFLNPGGPGGSGTNLALLSSGVLSPTLLDRFDIIGFDPRGVGFSDQMRCWPNVGAQAKGLDRTQKDTPFSRAEQARAIRVAKGIGSACSRGAQPLVGSMSTAEVARDMDVLRRVLGDRKLNYLGFSYGTQLGQVYAAMFPDRLRAIVLDGVVNPVAWTGTPATAGVPVSTRLRSGEGGDKALRELLSRCATAPVEFCPPEISRGDAVAMYARVTAALRKAPLRVDRGGGRIVTITYSTLMNNLLRALNQPTLVDLFVLDELRSLDEALAPGTPPAARRAHVAAYQGRVAQTAGPQDVVARVAARQAIARQRDAVRGAAVRGDTAARPSGLPNGYGFPYDNEIDTYLGVLCTDTLNPARAEAWPAVAAAADRSAPGFGPLWTWASAPCAGSTWTARDEDAYRGPFNRRTSAPVLVIGNYWDPATNYDSAVAVSRMLPNSRLLSSDNWGHTAYRASACVVASVDSYLLRGVLPAVGKVCTDGVQPFRGGVPEVRAANAPWPILPPLPLG